MKIVISPHFTQTIKDGEKGGPCRSCW